MTSNLVATVALIAATIMGAPASAADLGDGGRLYGAGHRYGVGRRPSPPFFDRRPALSQREIGTLSLEMLAVGADAALAEEAWDAWAPFGPPLPPDPYGP